MRESIERRFGTAVAWCNANRLCVVFVLLAVLVRLIFWFYTRRIWEDALITLAPARNVWAGFGLTHHASEPRVHSFTSPISVLIPLVGEAFHAGILSLRISSLFGAVATIYFAYRIGVILAFEWFAHVLVLAYLACDQLQIFFGMAGMETQVVTAVALAAFYLYLARKWTSLGFACGLATISRPEFVMFLLPVLGAGLVIFHRAAILRVATASLVFAVPWYAFATLYYGSPVPQTIAAKSHGFQVGLFSSSWHEIRDYTIERWGDFVPFKEFWFHASAPVPDLVLQLVLGSLLLLFVVGFVAAARARNAVCVAAIAVVAFIAYRNSTIQNSYYMWYLPPFLALGFLVAAYGASESARRLPRTMLAVSLLLAVAYAVHLPFSMPLDRKVQRFIESAVRQKTGRTLNAMMTSSDTAVLEPLGWIGIEAFNKTIFDYPGLGSRVVLRAIKSNAVYGAGDLANALQPTYCVLRPAQFSYLQARYPATAARYDVVAHLQSIPGLSLHNLGYSYTVMDNDFRILRRNRDFEQVVRP